MVAVAWMSVRHEYRAVVAASAAPGAPSVEVIPAVGFAFRGFFCPDPRIVLGAGLLVVLVPGLAFCRALTPFVALSVVVSRESHFAFSLVFLALSFSFGSVPSSLSFVLVPVGVCLSTLCTGVGVNLSMPE